MKKEKTYRISEIFYSFQGEAVMAGKPSVWIRFFGCNLECSGFGQEHPTKPETHILPYKDFDVKLVSKLEELPVWDYGCDSSYSWSNKYKHLAKDLTVEEICDIVIDLMKHPTNPDGLFIHPITEQDTQLCFTGGEPMLNQKAMIDILNEFKKRDNEPLTITVETNGTQKLSSELADAINDNELWRFWNWHWAISPKLYHTSGEKNKFKPNIIEDYNIIADVSLCLKFVCNGSQESWNEIEENLKKLQCDYDIWIMPVGATKEQQESDQVAEIAIEAMKRGYNVATRNHCYVFGNSIGR